MIPPFGGDSVPGSNRRAPMREALENRIGLGWVADRRVPDIAGQQAGQHVRVPSVRARRRSRETHTGTYAVADRLDGCHCVSTVHPAQAKALCVTCRLAGLNPPIAGRGNCHGITTSIKPACQREKRYAPIPAGRSEAAEPVGHQHAPFLQRHTTPNGGRHTVVIEAWGGQLAAFAPKMCIRRSDRERWSGDSRP